MKKNHIFYVLFLCFTLVVSTGIFYHHINVNRFYRRFLKQHHLHLSDISFSHKGRPLGGDGFIFYQARFPNLKIVHKIDKLIIRENNKKTTIQMQGLQINVLRTLQQLYGTAVIEQTENYKPFKDALLKPFISLGLMGIDHLKGDAVFVFNTHHKPLAVNAKVSFPHLAEIQLSFSFAEDPAANLTQFLTGKVPEISIELMDNGLFQKYAGYLAATGEKEAAKAYRNELLRQNSFIRRIRFEKPADLKSFYYN